MSVGLGGGVLVFFFFAFVFLISCLAVGMRCEDLSSFLKRRLIWVLSEEKEEKDESPGWAGEV